MPVFVKVTVAIVAFGNTEEVLACVRSVLPPGGATPPELHVILVDNLVGDVSARRELVLRVEALAQELDVALVAKPAAEWSCVPRATLTLLLSDENRGYAGGNNLAARLAARQGADWLFLLNPDTALLPGSMDALWRSLPSLDERVGSAAVTIHDPTRPAGRPGVGVYARAGARTRPGSSWDAKFDYVEGAALLLRVDALRVVGLLDENFFLFWEELDLARRLAVNGREVGRLPSVHVQHAVGTAIGTSKHLGRRSEVAVFHANRSAVIFHRKHGLVPVPYVVAVRSLIAVPLILHGRWTAARHLLAGLVSGLRHPIQEPPSLDQVGDAA